MQHHVEIKKIITGGSGLGYLENGMVAMVPHVLPGEQVHISETKRFRGHVQAKLLSITHPSPLRQDPPCPYFTFCGGCSLQHMSYPLQLETKRAIVTENLERAGVATKKCSIHPTMPSPTPYGYRYTIRLHCDHTGALGFRRRADNQIVPIQACLLATRGVNTALAALLNNERYIPVIALSRSLELIASPETDEICLVVDAPTGLSQKQIRPFSRITKHVVTKTKPREGLPAHTALPLGQRFTCDTLEYGLYWDHNCFFQANSAQNQNMVSLVIDILRPKNPRTVLDLFCGTGNFSIPLALTGSRVHGVEHNPHSVRWAQTNAYKTGCEDRCTFTAQNVVRFLRSNRHRNYSTIILDPPRQGLGKKNAQILGQTKAGTILYISCDPATLSRDLAVLCGSGFQCIEIFPIDMFPQTHHIESIAVLEKESQCAHRPASGGHR